MLVGGFLWRGCDLQCWLVVSFGVVVISGSSWWFRLSLFLMWHAEVILVQFYRLVLIDHVSARLDRYGVGLEIFYIITKILQRIRIIVRDAGFEPGTSGPEVRCATSEPPRLQKEPPHLHKDNLNFGLIRSWPC